MVFKVRESRRGAGKDGGKRLPLHGCRALVAQETKIHPEYST